MMILGSEYRPPAKGSSSAEQTFSPSHGFLRRIAHCGRPLSCAHKRQRDACAARALFIATARASSCLFASFTSLPLPFLPHSRFDSAWQLVTEDGSLYTMGWGQFGSLGLGDEHDRLTPSKVSIPPPSRTVSDRLEGSRERSAQSGEEVLMAACGGAHTAALSRKGQVWTWGEGGWGQLGHSDGQDCLSPVLIPPSLFAHVAIVMVACGGGHSGAICAHGHLYTWGAGLWGQLGNDSRHDRLAPGRMEARLLGGGACVFVAAGANHTAVLCVPQQVRAVSLARALAVFLTVAPSLSLALALSLPPSISLDNI